MMVLFAAKLTSLTLRVYDYSSALAQ